MQGASNMFDRYKKTGVLGEDERRALHVLEERDAVFDDVNLGMVQRKDRGWTINQRLIYRKPLFP